MDKRPSTPKPYKLPPLKKNFNGSNFELNKMFKIAEPIIFRNENGNRLSLEFEKKDYYSYSDVIGLLEKMDQLWESGLKEYDYFS